MHATPGRKWKALWFVLAGLWLCTVAAAFVYLYVFDGWSDVTKGRFHVKAHALFEDVEGITEVRIKLLRGDPKKRRVKPGDTIGYGSVTLTGKDLNDFLELWRFQSPAANAGAMCHMPAYRFELFRGSRLIASSNVCWMCSNYSFEAWPGEGSLYGFEARSPTGQALLEFCDSRLPYYRPPD